MTGLDVSYVYDGGTLVQEKRGNNATVYYTDANGRYYGFKTYTVGSTIGANYYNYVYNGQGDVIKIVHATGNVVAEYEYDAWGKITKIMGRQSPVMGELVDITDGSNPTWVAHTNPIRYRGYYWDAETGLYYCQSRYYDPTVGRFINADGLIDDRGVITQNMFAYCGNNPVNRLDNSGYKTESLEEEGKRSYLDFLEDMAIVYQGTERMIVIDAAIAGLRSGNYTYAERDGQCYYEMPTVAVVYIGVSANTFDLTDRDDRDRFAAQKAIIDGEEPGWIPYEPIRYADAPADNGDWLNDTPVGRIAQSTIIGVASGAVGGAAYGAWFAPPTAGVSIPALVCAGAIKGGLTGLARGIFNELF